MTPWQHCYKLTCTVGNRLSIDAIKIPWCGSHCSTPINKAFQANQKLCSKIPKSWELLEQNSYTVFTRPFSSQPNIRKEEKWCAYLHSERLKVKVNGFQ